METNMVQFANDLLKQPVQSPIAKATADLLRACKDMLALTGGPDHWQGETKEVLKEMEKAVKAYEKEAAWEGGW